MTMTEDGDLYTPAQAREWQDGHGGRESDVLQHAGLVRDKRLSRFLTVMSQQYRPSSAERPDLMPGRAENLEVFRRIRESEASEVFRAAMDAGDMPTLKHFTGDVGQRADLSGMKALEDLTTLVSGPAPIFYQWGEPGNGKSNFAMLIGQIWKGEHPNGLLASNIRTLRETDEWTDEDGEERDGWIPNFGALEEWIEQDGDPMDTEQTSKLFIFDEASSSAGGSGSSGYQTKSKMGPLAYKIRKFGGALIVIGHDGKDVHPLIRELGVAVHKESVKEATFYEDVRNRKGVRAIMSVGGIPETDYRYNDREATKWSWARYEGDEYEASEAATDAAIWTAIRCKEEGMTNRETSQFVPFSHGWVGTRWREYRDEGMHEDSLSKVEAVIA